MMSAVIEQPTVELSLRFVADRGGDISCMFCGGDRGVDYSTTYYAGGSRVTVGAHGRCIERAATPVRSVEVRP